MATTIIPHIKLETETFLNGELDVIKLEGREVISQLFEYEILAVCRDTGGVEPEELCGQEAAIVYERDGQQVRRVYGMISAVSDRLETETQYSTYRLTFVPRAYRLTLVETLDVFLDINVPDVIRQKMKDAGFQERAANAADPAGGSAALPLGSNQNGPDFELRLYETYPLRDIIVQYKETDIAFISRLCEHLGISFFFEHSAGRDVMVFTDMNEGFRAIEGGPSVRFQARGEHTDVFSFEETIRMIPAQYVVRDYNYRTPQVTLTGQAQVPTGLGSIVEYGSHVKTPDEAEKLAHIRAQERMAQRRIYQGKSDVPEIASGARMTLEGHPRGDTKLLVTEVEVRAEQVTLGVAHVREAFFHADFKAISETRRYRPPRLTPKPRISGVVNGVIDSPKDDTKYADVDDQGRYRVRFLFDTTSPDKGQASKLVRMAQPHSGEGYGMHFPLRPGVEVIITFVDGDPDRPIIAATVPNPQTASPVQAGNAPRNIIRTGAGNEINIDDTHDSTRIKMSVPHKSTVFQLGAPNSPERGAMLETQGAYSTMALSGTAAFQSFKGSVTALTNFVSSGSIHTVAEIPGFFERVASLAELSASLIETASSAIEVALAAREAHVAELKVASIQAQVRARQQRAAAKQAHDDMSSSALPLEMYGIQSYRDAKAKIDAAYPDKTSPSYQQAMAVLLKEPGMLAAKENYEYGGLPTTSTGAVDKTSQAYRDWAAEERKILEDKYKEEHEGQAPSDAALDALVNDRVGQLDQSAQSTRSAYQGIATKKETYETELSTLEHGATFDADVEAYATAYRAAHAGTTLTDAQLREMYIDEHLTDTAKQGKALAETGEKMKAYDEAQNAYQKGVADMRVNEEFLRDSKMGGEYVGRTTNQVQGYERSIEANKTSLYGDPNSTDPAAKKGLYGQLQDARTGLGTTPSDLPSDISGQLAAYNTQRQAVDTAYQADQTAWDAADASKKAYDKEVEEMEHGDAALTLKEHKSRLDKAKAGASALVLFSEIMGALVAAKEAYHEWKEKKPADATFWKYVKESVGRALKDYKTRTFTLSEAIKKKFVKHTLGSSWDTEVFAEHELILRADEVLKILSKDEFTVTGKKLTVGGTEKVEVASGDEMLLTAKKGKFDIDAKEIKIASDEDTMVVSRHEKLSLRAYKDVELLSSQGSITASALSKDVTLKAAKKAALLAGTWGLQADADAKTVTLGNDAWQVKVADGQVDVGSAGPAAHLTLKSDAATLQTSGKLTLAGGPIAMVADKVDFAGAEVVADNFLVKGMPLSPALEAIKAKVRVAQSTAKGAAKAADTATSMAFKARLEALAAQRTADEALETSEAALGDATVALRAVADLS